jgi:hypothetical protein
MILARVMIASTALVWLCYGTWVFFDPHGLDYTGLGQPGWPATVEVVAMYGAFEAALGAWTALGLVRERQFQRPVLTLWALLYTALVVGRVYGLLVWDGSFTPALGDTPDSYNAGAMYVLELPSAVLFWVALWRTRGTRGAPRPAPAAT